MREHAGTTVVDDTTSTPAALGDRAATVLAAPDSSEEELSMSHMRSVDGMRHDETPSHDEAIGLLANGVVEDWRELGECRGADLSLFYPDDEDDLGAELAAKAICTQCAVREQCLEQALESRERNGVWGGLSPRERRRILRRRRRVAA